MERQALFLHGGPGLSAAIERAWFGDAQPVHWWDQPPLPAGCAAAFASHMAAVREKLCAMSEAAGGAVELIAHSAAGRIAHALVVEEPARVNRVTLLACPHDVAPPLLRLCRRLLEIADRPALAAALLDAEVGLDARRLEALAFAAAGHPAWPGAYFGRRSRAARERFLMLLARAPPFDAATFLAITTEWLAAGDLAPLPAFAGPVRLVLGRDDPVVIAATAAAAWRRVFPNLQVDSVDAGHFIHLEAPVAAWFGHGPAASTAAEFAA